MPQGIVQYFQIIEIDIQMRSRRPLGDRGGKRRAEPISQGLPIRKFGQDIIKGKVLDSGLIGLPTRNIPEVDRHAVGARKTPQVIPEPAIFALRFENRRDGRRLQLGQNRR